MVRIKQLNILGRLWLGEAKISELFALVLSATQFVSISFMLGEWITGFETAIQQCMV